MSENVNQSNTTLTRLLALFKKEKARLNVCNMVNFS